MDLERVSPALRERLGAEGAGGLLDLLARTQHDWTSGVSEVISDRFERRLTEETSKLRVEMAQGFAAVRQEMAKGNADLRQTIADQKFEILKWMFIFWTGQFFVTASFVVMVIRALRTG